MIYYVDPESGNNSNTGFSVSEPLKDLSIFYYKGESSIPLLNYGDTIAIKRGTTLYGSHLLHTGYGYKDDTIRPYITLTSYGNGTKPKLSLAKVITSPSAYTNVENNIWSIDLSVNTYIKGYTATNSYAYNVGYLYDDRTENLYGDRKFNLSDLSKNGDFYVSGSVVYMFFDSNPYTYINKIIGNHSNDCLIIPINNMIIEGLCFTESSGHGIKSNELSGFSNIIIRNNDFINIGGALWKNTTRLGNGVEIYNSAHGWRVFNNNFINIYDTATTAQGNNSVYENITFYNNYIEKCNNAFEIWCDAGATENTGYKDVTFSNNIINKSGTGFGGIGRENTSAIILLGDHQLHDITFKDNVFLNTKYYVFNKLVNKYQFVNNRIIGSTTSAIFGDGSTYNIDNIKQLESVYKNFTGTKASYLKNDTISEKMIVLELMNNSISDASIKDNELSDIYKHNTPPYDWIFALSGTVNVISSGICNNMYFFNLSFKPSENIKSWTTFLINRDSRIRPKSEIRLESDDGTAFKIYKGTRGTNSAVYIQSYTALSADTTYKLRGFYNIY